MFDWVMNGTMVREIRFQSFEIEKGMTGCTLSVQALPSPLASRHRCSS